MEPGFLGTTNDGSWHVRVTDWRGVVVYDGVAPCPNELIEYDEEHPDRLFTFDMRPIE